MKKPSNMISERQISEAVTRVYLYALNTKFIHYSTKRSHMHQLTDEAYWALQHFADNFAEAAYGIIGKPPYNIFSVKTEISQSNDLRNICTNVKGVLTPIRTKIAKEEEKSGIVSMIDDVFAKLDRITFLCTFDKIAEPTE